MDWLEQYIHTLKTYPTITHEWIPHNFWSHTGYEGFKYNFIEICKSANIDAHDLHLSYLDNLMRLKLIDCREETAASKLTSRFDEELEIEQSRTEYMFITNFGEQFIEACLTEINITT